MLYALQWVDCCLQTGDCIHNLKGLLVFLFWLYCVLAFLFLHLLHEFQKIENILGFRDKADLDICVCTLVHHFYKPKISTTHTTVDCLAVSITGTLKASEMWVRDSPLLEWAFCLHTQLCDVSSFCLWPSVFPLPPLHSRKIKRVYFCNCQQQQQLFLVSE